MNFDFFTDLFFSGITKGSIYALVALGYTMVYGIIGLINFAHGEIYMIGAFIAISMCSILAPLHISVPILLLIAISISIVFTACYAFTVEKIAYEKLRNSSRLAPLISAIGMSLLLREYVLLFQTSNFINFPELLPEVSWLDFMSDYLLPSQFIIIASAFTCMVALILFLKYTRSGIAMRAIAEDQVMTRLLGININSTISLTFIIGSALAAVAAVLISSYIGQANYNMGFIIGIKAFTAAVLGGIGSVSGAMLGGIVLGLSESFATGYISSDYEDIVAFTILILILLFKPSGLLGKKEIEKV